jgi:pyridoxine kinase
MRDRLCRLADIITPNHFEFEFLCGAKATTTDQVIAQAQGLLARGPSTIVVTSAELSDTPDGEIETLAVEQSRERLKAWSVRTPKLPISPSGTGDLFASLFVAARVRQKDTPDALSHAASAIFAVLERTASSGTEEMRIVESAEQLTRPKRRFDAVAVPQPLRLDWDGAGEKI